MLIAGDLEIQQGLYVGGATDYTHIDSGGNILPKGDAFIIIQKASGQGIKIDQSIPTFGFRDLLGEMTTRPAAGRGAAAVPDYVAYRGNIFGYRFGTIAPDNHIHETFIEFHMPHDYVPGTEIFVHVHWSQITVDTGGTASAPGVAEWIFEITYADGYGTAGGSGDPFVAPKTIPVTQQGSTTQYAHMIAEIAITGASDTSTTFDRDTIEVDGLFLVGLTRDEGSANDTLNQAAFVHFIDIHYRSTNVGTKDKNAPFYT